MDDKTDNNLLSTCRKYLETLCLEIQDRSVGSAGNRLATLFFDKEISSFGWQTESQEFPAMDWQDGGATLRVDNKTFQALVSPYSLGCDAHAPLACVRSVAELERKDIKGKIVLLHGEIAKEQLMPKNFVFYNPEEHQKIISVLETKKPAALICATGRNAALAGGVYPFPLIEDGDFNIPSVYMTEEEGKKLLTESGKMVHLKSISERIPGHGYNVVARKGRDRTKRIILTAHIDAKKGTPGAIDNATGATILLLLAKVMAKYNGEPVIEIVAFNGEDYFAVPGQMLYIKHNQDRFSEVLLNINIDGAGYKEGKSSLSLFGVPDEMAHIIKTLPKKFPGLTEGIPWPQGDHSIFIQYGCPAIAVSSEWFINNINDQDITHTPKDNLEIVSCEKLLEIVSALKYLLEKITA